MHRKAFQHFIEAWNKIKQGELFDEGVNNTFDYMLKSLQKSEYEKPIKTDIIKHLPSIFAIAKHFDNPPPIFYILISMKDGDIIKELQSLILLDWIKSNASESSTFQVINFIETFDEKGVPITAFVNAVIKNVKASMTKDMIEALLHMITIQHSEYMKPILKKLLDLKDEALLKTYVQMNGRKALLELTQIAPPALLAKLFTKN